MKAMNQAAHLHSIHKADLAVVDPVKTHDGTKDLLELLLFLTQSGAGWLGGVVSSGVPQY